MPAPEPAPDPQAVLTVLTTEHFALQGSRASTISESTSRAALLHFTLAAMVAALDAVVGGTAVAFVVGAVGAALAVAAAVGAVAAVASFLVFTRWQRRYHAAASEGADVLFPTPA